MSIRMSGLMSGLDTESIVKQLMSAQSLKKTKVEQAKTKLEWTQTAWSDLNTKLVNLYNNFVSKMQLSSSYKTKKATISDSSKASVSADVNAVNGSYTLEVNKIATTQYVTGGVIDASSTKTKLTELDPSLNGKQITVQNGEKTVSFFVDGNTTISDFVSQLKSAGLSASFDASQKRLFISGSGSGAENAYSITSPTQSAAELTAAADLRTAVGYDDLSADRQSEVNKTLLALQSSGIYETAEDGTQTYTEEFTDALKTLTRAQQYSNANYSAWETAAKDAIAAREDYAETFLDEDGNLKQEEYDKAVAAEVEGLIETYVDSRNYDDSNTDTDFVSLVNVAKAYANVGQRTDESTTGTSALAALGLGDIAVDEQGVVKIDGVVLAGDTYESSNGMAFVRAQDSEIRLNGALLTSSTLTVSANGLNIDLISTTKPGESVSFTVANDVDGVYDSIKSFLKEYNSVMEEMNKLYNAESAKGYEPLTSEQKEAMSEEEVKLWEEKIKNALLRSDTTLSGIIQSMRNAMMGTVTYEGSRYALSSFGIMTSTNYTEGGLLHIYGDPDDSTYSDQADKLKKALTENPDAVIATLTGIFSNLRNVMFEKMKGSTTSSALTFYEDIKMKSDISQYEDDIAEWEDRLAALEDAYYSKFTAMETALAQLQSKQSALSSIMGVG